MVAVLAAGAVVAAGPPEHGLRYQTPAATWDEGFPLGNGMMGALVWGDGHPLRISLDRADLWDTRPVAEFSGPDYKFSVMKRWHEQGRVDDLLRVYEKPYNRAAPTKVPAGRIELRFPDAAKFGSASLNIANGLAAVNFADGGKAEVFIHATEAVGMVRLHGHPAISLAAPAFGGSKEKEGADTIVAGGDLRLLGYPAPAESSGADWRAFEQQGSEGFRFAVYVQWREDLLGWSIASTRETADPLALARDRVARALDAGFPNMLEASAAWWTRYWAQSGVTVPNRIVERQWYLDMYKWGSAARRGAPPITLQAVWTADNGRLPPWKGDYHHDLNTQLSYWPAYSGNHLEEGLSYLEWLWKTRDTAFEWTRTFFELPGLNVPMTADLNGRQIGGWRQYTHSATTSAWLAHHFYLHWRYSQDREFLEQRAYPYLRDAAVFLEAFTAGRDQNGKRTHSLSSSPEMNDNRPSAWFDRVTNYDLALDRWVFTKAAELAAELNLSEDRARWLRVLSEFPDFSLGADGAMLVAPGFPLPGSHRHFSHLMAIHPLGLIDQDQGRSAQRTIRASLRDLRRKGTTAWCGYSFSWLGNLAARARDGIAAERALEIFASAFCLRNSFHVNGDQSGKGYSKMTYRPFTLEGNFAMPAGLNEMLIQSHAGRVVLFPAVPAKWKDAEFRGLRAEGAFVISAVRRGGKVIRVEVTAEKGGKLRLERERGRVVEIDMRPGEHRVL